VRTLGADEAHVWIARLDGPSTRHARDDAGLGDEERARASCMPDPRVRARFVTARVILRGLLSRYTGIAPAALRLRTLASGKPVLDHHAKPPEIHFNVAHSGDLALIAFGRRALGIDVELLRDAGDDERLARAVLSPSERAALLAHPHAERSAALLRGWTRKEAYLKATGEGIRARPTHVEVTLDAARAALIRVAGDAEVASRWKLHDVDAGRDAVGALAVAPDSTRNSVAAWRG
jgi:4'-phosphopantetheinyl transferase